MDLCCDVFILFAQSHIGLFLTSKSPVTLNMFIALSTDSKCILHFSTVCENT